VTRHSRAIVADCPRDMAALDYLINPC